MTMVVTNVVLQAGAAVDHQDEEDRDTPAHAASRYVVISVNIIIKLLFFNFIFTSEIHLTILYDLIPRSGYSQSLELLCREGGNLYLKNRGGFTPLHLCCQVQHTIALHCTSLTIFRQGTTSAAGCC